VSAASSAAWIRATYNLPLVERYRRVAYSGNPRAGRQLGTIVGFHESHLRIQLDGERRILTTHPAYAIEYLPEKANERTCARCGRVGISQFRRLDPGHHAEPTMVCSREGACRIRRRAAHPSGRPV
jgi:hypothetical protein